MNKQDKKKLTKHIELNQHMTEISMFGRTAVVDVVLSDRLLDLIDELASPVKVPSLIAEWYEENKHNILESKFRDIEHNNDEKVREWYANCQGRHINNRANAQEVISMMDLFGYEVEDPEWTVITDGGYLKEFEFPQGTVTISGEIEFKTTDKSKAEAAAELVSGSIKEV